MKRLALLAGIGMIVLAGAQVAAGDADVAGGDTGAAMGDVTTAADDSLTLQKAVDLAVRTHPSVEQASSSVAAARAQVGVARSGLYPDVSVEGTYTRLDPVSYMELPPEGVVDFFPHNNYDVHLTVGQKIYDAGRTEAGIHLAEGGVQTARDNLENARWALAYQVAATFHQILILREAASVLDEQIQTLEQHLDLSRKRFETGSATRLDVLTTQVRVASARNTRIDTGNALTGQEIVFRQLTGMSREQPVLLRGSFPAVPLPLGPDSLLMVATRSRPELRTAQDAESTARISVRLASLGEKPSLRAGIASGFKNGYFPGLNRMKANVAASLNLEFPLFDGRRSSHQEEQARANLRAAEAHSAQIRRLVASEVEQALASARADEEKIRNAEVQVDRAREAVAMAETQYRAGVITNLDLLDAETSMAEARLMYLQARYAYVTSLTTLDRATGRKIW